MKFGLMFINAGPFSQPELFAHMARTAEECGFESIWTVEHVVIPKDYKSPYPYSPSGKIPGPDEVPINDPLLPLAYAAAITKKLRLATGIVILPQHHPLYLAKQAATLDVLSGGRMILGVGSGWLKEEFDALGIDFATRGRRTDEGIEAMRALWRDHPSNFHGKIFNFGPVASFPKPVQKGGVPIHIGGHTAAAVRRAAAYGDGFFPAIGDAAKLRELTAMLRAECDQRGRNFGEIERSCLGRATPESIALCQELGIERLIVTPPGLDPESFKRGCEQIGNEVIAKG
ncbi:MAG TPA: LLM class F420-dependent oxidoreductase [Candidatus Binataceae bacterium]|nr:LLM class F420-dependent oxidoreductase [Candidatus Binataceae bacterium]